MHAYQSEDQIGGGEKKCTSLKHGIWGSTQGNLHTIHISISGTIEGEEETCTFQDAPYTPLPSIRNTDSVMNPTFGIFLANENLTITMKPPYHPQSIQE